MQWFFIALGAPFLWAIVNVADNYLVSRFSRKEEERSSGGLVLFSSFIGIFVALAIWIFIPEVFSIPILDKLLLFVSGILTIIWIILYLFSLEIEEASSIVPLAVYWEIRQNSHKVIRTIFTTNYYLFSNETL